MDIFLQEFIERPDDSFSAEFYEAYFSQDINWVNHDSGSLLYISDINSSTEEVRSHQISQMLPSPALSGAYSRAGSQSSVEVFCSDLDLSASSFLPPPQSEQLKARSYQCTYPGCTKKFTRRDNIKYHLKTHDPIRDRPFSCTKCSKSYFRAIDLSRHFRVTHDKVKGYSCPECAQSYTRKEALTRHVERKH